MQVVTFGEGRKALRFGVQKLNLHPAVAPLAPHARELWPGGVDLCLLMVTPLDQVIAHLQAEQVTIEMGPVQRTGASGPILSVCFYDPDGNLIELGQPL